MRESVNNIRSHLTDELVSSVEKVNFMSSWSQELKFKIRLADASSEQPTGDGA